MTGPEPASAPVLRRLGRYHVVAKLGQGGMAEVYLAVARGSLQDHDFHKFVVLKVLHAQLARDEQFVRMFMKEAKIAARLAHPNVVHTYTVGQEGGRYCIVMEYLDGVSLNALNKRGGHLSFDERLPLLGAVSQALAGLHYVHEFRDYDGTHFRLVHRDIKPANLLATFDGAVKVLDFGVAKMTATDATASQVVKGTVQYMAPEALDISKRVDGRIDVFAMGLVLWEMATGERFWGQRAHVDVLRALASNQLPELRGRPNVPDSLVAICQRALALDPTHRYASAREFKTDLDAFLAGQARPSGPEALASLCRGLFGELRARRSETIQRQLAALEQASDRNEFETEVLPSFSATHGHPAIDDEPPPARRRRPTGVVAAVVVGVVMATSLGLALAYRHRLIARLSPITLADEPNEPPPPRMVKVRVSAQPAAAQLFLDGQSTPNPTVFATPDDGQAHTVEARAAGYRAVSATIRYDENVDLRLELDPE